MRRVLLSGVAPAILYTVLTGCVSDLSRGIAFCQETYFGFARSTCELEMRQKFSLKNPGSEQ